ncbi:MAG: radical SAM protein [Nitrospinota bacterium]|nr:radical SAM protein [Nitrospinota bacterium]
MELKKRFSLNENELEEILARRSNASRPYEALGKEHLFIDDFASILKKDDGDPEFFEKLAQRAREITNMRFGLVKGLYIPLYLSNACHNSCTYCGFSIDNRVKRVTLKIEEVHNELKTIYAKGFRNILLVSGELKDFSNREYLAECVKAARDRGFHSIAVELGALDGESAKMLAKAGAQSFVLYQETYHRETYGKIHTGGLKKDFDLRLQGIGRAIEAGFKQATLGFLAGLHDYRFEALALYSHLSFLKKEYRDIEFSVSFPRLTQAYGVRGSFERVKDKSYATMLMAFRLAFPEVSINLSTRETPAFRDGMSRICATHLSVESKTQPGGYIEGENGELEQFTVHDGRTLDEMTAALKRMGYDVHFKDWEMELNRI